MPNVASPLGTTQRYIPAVPSTQIGRYAGLAMHFPTLAALNTAIADEVLNIGEASAIWTDNQPFSVATEAATLTYRLWKTSLQHARTVVISSDRTVVLASNTNTVLATTGIPSGGTGADGDIAIDRAANLYYTKAAGTWSSSGTINVMSQADKTKLDGIATGATANATDAQLRDRSTHTGTQLAATISDLSEAVDDRVATLLVAGTNITLNYNDVANTLTINSTGGTGSTNLTTTAAPTTVTINSDTGTDAVIAAADGTNAGLLLPAEKTKLSGIATGATANSPDATLVNRANHTGTQLAATISDFAEAVDDRVGALLVAGSNITLNYNDASNTLTISAAGGAGATNLTTTAAPTTVTINSDTGTDAIIAAADGTNAGLFLPAEKSKLAGIAAGATANATDSALRDRSTHTGTQPSTSLTAVVETRSTFPYTVVASDNGKVLLLNSASAANVTVNGSLGAGFSCTFVQVGAGRITFLEGSGVTLENFSNLFTTSGPYAPVSLIPMGLDIYNLAGSVGLLSELPELAETIDDRVATLLVAGTNVTLNYNDASNTLTINASGGGATNLTTTAAPTTVTINSDTGTDAVIAAADGTNAGLFLPAEKTKLAGIATGATANSSDATLLDRANHTGTQTASTISDFAEAVDDRVGALLVAGTNITLNYNDAANTLTISATGGGGVATSQPWSSTIYIETPTNKTYPVLTESVVGLTVTSVRTVTDSGSCTVTVNIDGVNLGGSPNAASSTPEVQNHSSANVLAAAQDLNVVVSANATASGLRVTISGTRNLATA